MTEQKCICSALCSHECVCNHDWWEKLTDEEIIDLIDVDCPPDKAICGSTKGIIKLARNIEQKIKEKNS